METTRYVYDNTAADRTSLRKMIVTTFRAKQSRLWRHASTRAFKKLLVDAPDSACDYIKALSGILDGKGSIPARSTHRA